MLGRRGRGIEVMVGRKVEKDEQKPLYNRKESRKDKQGEERRERTKESWGLYQTATRKRRRGAS